VVADLARKGLWQLGVRANILLPGLYAWVTTVAYPAAHPSATGSARLTAGLALVALLVGAALCLRHPRAGSGVGVLGFVSACVLTWVLLRDLIDVGGLHPVRASLGAIGWSLFAFGWGAMRRESASRQSAQRQEQDADDAGAGALNPRGRLPRSVAVLLGLAVAGAAAPVVRAWWVARPDHALWAHGVALLCAIVVVTVAAGVTLRERRGRMASADARFRAAIGPLAVLAVMLAVGFVWRLFG
jgi:hypothetical protein